MSRTSPKFLKPFASFQFWKDLYNEIDADNIFNGAASLSYYFLLAIFPALIFMLTLLPYLPIQNLTQEVLTLINQALPDAAAKILEGPVVEITTAKKQGLLSFGAIFAIWVHTSETFGRPTTRTRIRLASKFFSPERTESACASGESTKTSVLFGIQLATSNATPSLCAPAQMASSYVQPPVPGK